MLSCIAVNGSTNPQLSKLWRGDFVRFAAVSVLRVKARYDCLPVLFRHDVHWQPTLSALRRRGSASDRRGTVRVEVPMVQDEDVFHHPGHDGHARMRTVCGSLGRGGGV